MSTQADLKMPYGVADFKTIRNEGLYYGEKTNSEQGTALLRAEENAV